MSASAAGAQARVNVIVTYCADGTVYRCVSAEIADSEYCRWPIFGVGEIGEKESFFFYLNLFVLKAKIYKDMCVICLFDIII